MKQAGKRVLSEDGRRRLAEAGSRNLAQYNSRTHTRVQELETEVNTYRAALLRDAGANPSASKLGLIEACVTTYASLLKVRYVLVHGRAKSDVTVLTERVSWLGSNLARLLKLLNLDAKSRPRSLSEVFARKGTATSSNSGQNAPEAVEPGGNPS